MNEGMIKVPQMLLIGSTGRNSGKTTLAAEFVRKWKGFFPIIGLKVTSIEPGGRCPRHAKTGCGACSGLRGPFALSEEKKADTGKDTSLLLEAGCAKVYWLQASRSYVGEGFRHFLNFMPEGSLVLCESNNLRRFAVPGVFIMLNNADTGLIKESAAQVLAQADWVVHGDVRNCIKEILRNIAIDDGGMDLKLIKNEGVG